MARQKKKRIRNVPDKINIKGPEMVAVFLFNVFAFPEMNDKTRLELKEVIERAEQCHLLPRAYPNSTGSTPPSTQQSSVLNPIHGLLLALWKFLTILIVRPFLAIETHGNG